MTICLIGCGDKKRDERSAAKDLYLSPAFRNRRAIAERDGKRWFILSGLHGVLDPEEQVDPYDFNLAEASSDQQWAWTTKVINQLREHLGSLEGFSFEMLAPKAYAWPLVDLMRSEGAGVEWPVEGMRQFEQQAYYAMRAAGLKPEFQESPSRVSPTYRALHEFLTNLEKNEVTMSFAQVEGLLGRDLPPSARKYQAWWSGSVVKSAIRGAGFRALKVDFANESVHFVAGRPDRPPRGFDHVVTPLCEPIELEQELVDRAVDFLSAQGNAESAATFPSRGQPVGSPGLYTWWGNSAARWILSSRLSTDIPSLIYTGQAGAGTGADLKQRILMTHIGGKIARSTFRLTLASLLLEPLDLQLVGPEQLSAASEDRLTEWIKENLSVAVFAYEDREGLRAFEEAVITRIDAPLNLSKMVKGDVRARLRGLRKMIRTGIVNGLDGTGV